MASFHQSFQVIKRSAGRSAVACAAYRSGSRLTDEGSGRVCDYSRRAGVVHAEILAPAHAPEWVQDRGRLWNAVEAAEKRKDAQLAREINMALPHELTAEARLALVRDYVRTAFVSRGMVADIAIHEPVAERGDDPRNVHAHVMLTMRQIGPGGFFRTKTREWNSDAQLTAWRSAWAEAQNRALERGGHSVRVDHRSLEEQRNAARVRGDAVEAARCDRAPEIHIGVKARAADRRQRPLASRERQAELPRQPRRSPQERPPAKSERVRRTVRYPQIDRGTRREWNAGIVAGNQARAYARAEHRERQAARLRQTELRALRAAKTAEQKLLSWQAPKASFWSRGKSQAAEAQRLVWEREWRLALQRAKRTRSLLGDVEKVLANLLHVWSFQQQRHLALTRVTPIGRTGGRGRSSGGVGDWLKPLG